MGYEYTSDIHQLQRSAELSGLLMRQSHKKTNGYISRAQKERLKMLQQRFLEEPVFIDDYSIPNEIIFYAKDIFIAPDIPALILNDSGIQLQSERFFEWHEIDNERVAKVSFSRMSPATGEDISAGSRDFFRFNCMQQYFEMPVSSLGICAWKLDLLLYMYRSRSALKFHNCRLK